MRMGQVVGMELRGQKRGGVIYVQRMFEQLHFKKEGGGGERKEKIGWPQREKRERAKLPSLISTSHVIVTSEFCSQKRATLLSQP